jgi:hypothetical protein
MRRIAIMLFGGAALVAALGPALVHPRTGAPARAPRAVGDTRPSSRPVAGDGRLAVTVATDDVPAVGVGVDVLPFSDPSAGRRRIAGSTDARGHVTFDAVPAGPVRIFAGEASRFWSVEPDERNDVTLAAPGGVTVSGTVRDGEGLPVAGASVWLSCPGAPDRGRIAATGDAGGRFRLDHVARGRRIAVRGAGFPWSEWREVPADGASSGSAAAFVLAGRSCTLRGIVVDDAGRPVPSACIGASCRAARVPMLETVSDEHGRFEIDGLVEGGWDVEGWCGGWAPARREAAVGADGGARSVTLRLERGASLEGVVRDSRGRALPRVRVSARDGRAELASAMTSDGGAFRLEHLPRSKVAATAGWLAGPRVHETVDLGAADRSSWDPVLAAAGVLSGAVTDELGRPRPFTRVRARSARAGGGWMAETIADAEGRFEIAECPESGVTLDLDPLRWESGGTWTVAGVSPRDGRVTIAVPAWARPAAFVTGRLLGPAGTPPSGVGLVATRAQDAGGPPGGAARPRAPDGSFRIGPLAPGEWIIDAVERTGSRTMLLSCTLAAEEELDVGERLVERPGFLKVVLDEPRDAPAGSRLVVLDARARKVAALRPIAGFAASGPMAPGAYRLSAGPPGSPSEIPFEIRAGETTSLEVPVTAAK